MFGQIKRDIERFKKTLLTAVLVLVFSACVLGFSVLWIIQGLQGKG